MPQIRFSPRLVANGASYVRFFVPGTDFGRFTFSSFLVVANLFFRRGVAVTSVGHRTNGTLPNVVYIFVCAHTASGTQNIARNRWISCIFDPETSNLTKNGPKIMKIHSKLDPAKRNLWGPGHPDPINFISRPSQKEMFEVISTPCPRTGD